MKLWFWGWLAAAAALAFAAAIARDRATAPFALGALAGAALEAAGVAVGLQWIAFLVVSVAVFLPLNRRTYRRRHSAGGKRGEEAREG